MSSISRYLSSILTSALPSSTSSSPSHYHDSPLYTNDTQHIFPSSSSFSSSSSLSKPSAPSLISLRSTTDLLAASVRSSLRTFNPTSPTKSDMRVLIIGSHSSYRAQHLSHSGKGDFPSAAFAVGAGKGGLGGAVYYCDSVEGLEGCRERQKEGGFDAILCFNAEGVGSESGAVVRDLADMLRAGGVMAGLGLFMRADGVDGSTTPTASSSSSSSSLPSTLLEFRDRVERHGFFMHTCVDLSLEGSIALLVMEEARYASSSQRDNRHHNNSNSSRHAVINALQAGKLIAARFLATKATAKRPHPQLTVQTQNTTTVSAPPSSSSASEHDKLSVENQLWSLSMSLSSGLQSITSSPYPSHSRSPSGYSTLSSSSFATPSSIDPIVITGISLGLPNALYPDRSVFSADNFASIFRGDNFISSLSSLHKQRILEQNVCQVYKKDGQRMKYRLQHDREVIQVAALIHNFDLAKEYPYIPSHVVEVLDTTYALAIAAGLEALKDAGIDVLADKEVDGELVRVIAGLPEHMRDDTGVIFASSFPCLDSLTEEVTKSAAAKARKDLKAEAAVLGHDLTSMPDMEYEYDRKLLFKLLVMANSQLAELVKARGPNTHINNACSGTTQAIAVAEDWIKVGRCKRVIVISADHATSDQLFPYLATGFLALGAATVTKDVSEAALPFDARRKGMILGAGAVGMVMESASVCAGRVQPKVEVLGTCISNSAFHASLMDTKTTSHQLNRFISRMELQHRIDRHTIADDLIYFSHETCTHSNGGCAKVEMDALGAAFTASKQQILLANTKGFTGHPMGVGMEDVIAVQSLHTGLVPPIANHKVMDPVLELNEDQLPRAGGDGRHDRRYVLRFAAGFGSQFAYVLYRKWEGREAEEETESVGSRSGDCTPRSPLPFPMSRERHISFGLTGKVPQA